MFDLWCTYTIIFIHLQSKWKVNRGPLRIVEVQQKNSFMNFTIIEKLTKYHCYYVEWVSKIKYVTVHLLKCLPLISHFPNQIGTGFPGYSRGLYSWEITIHEYQNHFVDFKYAKLYLFPLLFAVFPCFLVRK